MTAVWGPLGWMTLHSVSTMYPEQPTQAEKTLMTTWLRLATSIRKNMRMIRTL
jgi:hypothetical protein